MPELWCNLALLPLAYEPARAERALESLKERGCVPPTEQLPLLNAAFGNSPYLARLALREPEFLGRILEYGAEAVFATILDALNVGTLGDSIAGAMSQLRQAKRQAALAIALADISGAWTLEQVTGALTRFADSCVSDAMRLLIR